MKDDRFLMFAATHWETMCDDHRYVTDVKPQMWEWLSEIAGFSGDAAADLRGHAFLVVACQSCLLFEIRLNGFNACHSL